MLTVKIITEESTYLFSCKSVHYKRFFEKDVFVVCKSYNSPQILEGGIIVTDENIGVNKSDFIIVTIDDINNYVVMNPYWIYITNENGRTVESIS